MRGSHKTQLRGVAIASCMRTAISLVLVRAHQHGIAVGQR